MQSTSPSVASTVAVPSRPYPSRSPPAASPRPRPSSSGMNKDYDYRHHSRQNTVVPPISGRVHRRSYHGGFQPSFEPPAASSSQLYHQSTGSYSEPNVATLDMSSMFPSTPMSFTSSTLSPEIGNFDPFSLTVPSFPFDSQLGVASSSGQNAVQQEHVLYYFEHVRKMQFIFAGSNLVTNIIYSVSLNITSPLYSC